MLEKILEYQFYNNTGKEYLIALAVFVGALIILKIIKSILVGRLKHLAQKTKNDMDDAVIKIFSKIRPPFYFLLSLFLGIQCIALPNNISKIIKVLFIIILVYEVINAVQGVIEYIALRAISKNKDDKSAKSTVKTLSIVIKIVLWSFGAILILGNLGINVNSLIAGLGIGGIAVALALQNILSDVFSSFSILIDKPFQVGDLIKIGEDIGTVEKIGIKTTKLRTLDGQVLIVANQELTTVRVQNFKHLEKRRALFTLGIIYQTDKDKLKQIPQIIKNIVEVEELAEFDRCHFRDFGDSSLNFETSFYVNTQDYLEFRNVVERVNLAIFDEFAKNKIEFAYPTSVQYQKH